MRRLTILSAALAAAVFVSGCDLLPKPGPQISAAAQEFDGACDSYTEELNLMSIRNALGHLSEEAQAEVDAVVLIVGPICRGTYKGLSEKDALARVNGGLEVLAEVKKGLNDGV